MHPLFYSNSILRIAFFIVRPCYDIIFFVNCEKIFIFLVKRDFHIFSVNCEKQIIFPVKCDSNFIFLVICDADPPLYPSDKCRHKNVSGELNIKLFKSKDLFNKNDQYSE